MFKIRNWSRFQHYSNRNPPWIKLYNDLLVSEDWIMANDTTKLLLVACLLIGSRADGTVPNNPEYIRKATGLSKVDFLPLVQSGFLIADGVDASTMLATRNLSSVLLDSNSSNKRFIKPSLEDLKIYCKERSNNVDPQAFLDFYESKGWKVGQTPMKDWKAAVRTWEKRDGGKQAPPLPKTCDFETCNRPGTNHHFGRHYCKAHLPL